jgi:hypothetical protein
LLIIQTDCRSDEYCPHCDNHYVLEAITPKAALKVESEDVRVDARWVKSRVQWQKLTTTRMLKDDRIKEEPQRTIFNVQDAPDRLG